MACMEHVCRRCGRTVFNNSGSGGKCPGCGGYDWQSTWDEQDSYRDDDRDDDDTGDE